MKLQQEHIEDRKIDSMQHRLMNLFRTIPFEEGQDFEFQCYPADLPKRLPYKLKSPPKHLVLTYLVNETIGGAQPTTGVWVDWIADNGSIKINNITGLTAANLYTVRLLAFA